MRKIKNVTFLDLLSSFNTGFGLVRTSDVEQTLWFQGDDWDMTDAEKETEATREGYHYPSYEVGKILFDTSGNITALNLGPYSEGHSVLYQLCAFITDRRDCDGYVSDFDMEMVPDGHLIRITVYGIDEYPVGDDGEMHVSRFAMGVLTYDSRLKALIAA